MDFPDRLEGRFSAAPSSELRASEVPPQLEDVGAFEHLIERNDTSRPLTPPVVTMISYVDPERLPPSNGIVEEFGQRKRLYGSVRVLEEHAPAYEVVRRHIAESGHDVRKHLAEIETRAYPITDVYPYSLSDAKIRVLGRDESLPEGPGTTPVSFPAHSGNPGHTRVVVSFPTNSGNYWTNGERSSAATMATHELAHSARYRVSPSGGLIAPIEDQTPDELFQDLDEYAVISQVENQVARTHGEGERDSYEPAGLYSTRSLTSTVASDQSAERAMVESATHLRNLTNIMKEYGFPNVSLDRPTGPDETLRNLYWERYYQHGDLTNQLGEVLPVNERENLHPTAGAPQANLNETHTEERQLYEVRERSRSLGR